MATGANEKIAHSVAGHLGIFSEVLASNELINLSGKRKLACLEEKFGPKGFVYAGNGKIDLPIWEGASSGIIVNASSGLIRKAKSNGVVSRIFSDRKAAGKQFFQAIRVHQWVKNLLIFVPLVTSQSYADPKLTWQAIWAFIAFSLCASSVYAVNDLLDLEADRNHFNKRGPPLCCRQFIIDGRDIRLSYTGHPKLFNRIFSEHLLPVYFGRLLTSLHSLILFILKKMVLVDVFTLAFLFTLRIFSGAAAIDVEVSQWLLAFSIFIFVSLAFVKRFSELQNMEKDKIKVDGRGYLSQDVSIVGIFGIASGYISVVIFALYINSDQVELLYTFPRRLWSICVLLFFWVSRVWLLAYRGELNEDPILFAVKDKASYFLGLLAVIAILLAN